MCAACMPVQLFVFQLTAPYNKKSRAVHIRGPTIEIYGGLQGPGTSWCHAGNSGTIDRVSGFSGMVEW